ncbi:MAG TPA: HAD-IB family phosphatase [Candidatus Saccharimonadales bacterium]|nr:HAD-IB family phosphatase [Candidatus Saccharimonadales bacterium]
MKLPDELLYADRKAAQIKLDHFSAGGAAKLHIVFDFDRTLTVNHSGSNDDVTTWSILQRHLPPAGHAVYQQLYEHYRALELARSLTREHAATWTMRILDLFAAHNLDLVAVERDFLSKATIRPGTKELFELCRHADIPTVIISAGIRQIIELWTRAFGLNPTIILASSLQLDDNQRTIGWDKGSLIHIMNKNEADHPDLTRLRSERPHTLLIGDGLKDAEMASGHTDVFRVRIYDPRSDEQTASAAVRSQTFEYFDALLETGDFEPVQQLLADLVR